MFDTKTLHHALYVPAILALGIMTFQSHMKISSIQDQLADQVYVTRENNQYFDYRIDQAVTHLQNLTTTLDMRMQFLDKKVAVVEYYSGISDYWPLKIPEYIDRDSLPDSESMFRFDPLEILRARTLGVDPTIRTGCFSYHQGVWPCTGALYGEYADGPTPPYSEMHYWRKKNRLMLEIDLTTGK